MKFKLDLVKAILSYIETNAVGNTAYRFLSDDIKNISPDDKLNEIYGHLKILADEGFVDGSIGHANTETTIIDLTYSGHQLLEAIRNNTILNKIKNIGETVSLELLKQIPTLAISVLLQLSK